MGWAWLLAAAVILAVASLFSGVTPLTPTDVLEGLSDVQVRVLVLSRIPRLLSILLAGMSMSVCGLIMQRLAQNRFVSPTTAGTLDATRLGILVSMLFFGAAPPLVRMLVALAFAWAGTWAFMRMLERIKLRDPVFIPLAGMMYGGIIGSAATYVAVQYDLVQNVSSWLLGDFSLMMRGRYELLYAVVPALVLAYLYANQFTIAGMGEDVATNLGLSYRAVVNLGLGIVASTTAVVVVTVGTLPFLGLIVPNLVSILWGDNLRRHLPVTVLLGAVVTLACDLLGRWLIFPYEIPINVTLGVLGSVMFLFLIVRRTAHAG
ncbi:MAG: iron ABC transporter permease [Firmicutes bacterium ZCTH02-B6]|nr:MAG: iron ABC transporter permease [Firmicutes bacterium ZCTH02-B6]